MDDLKMFLKLGVKAPITTAEVPATLESLESKKKEFEEKRDKVRFCLTWGCRGKCFLLSAAPSRNSTITTQPTKPDTNQTPQPPLITPHQAAAAAEAEGEDAEPLDDTEDDPEEEAPKDPVAIAEASKPVFDDVDADSGLPGCVPVVAPVQGVWGARAAAAAAGVAA